MFPWKHLAALAFSLFLAVGQLSAANYEAESASLAGGTSVAADHTGYTGSGFIGGFTDANKGAAKVTFTVSAASAGSASLTLRFANGTGSPRTLSLYVNGTKIKQTTLGTTANWDSWATQAETVTLNSGSNTVAYQYDSTDTGNVNVDNLNTGSVNLAAGKTVSANASNGSGSFGPSNANDGSTGTYWEGAANAYPNQLTVDLGSSSTVSQVVLKLNPAWGDRTQTLSILGSTDNSTYSPLSASAAYPFASASSNVVTINFTSATARYVRLNFTANTGSTGAQVAEFEVYGSGGTPPPTSPDLVITGVTWTPASITAGSEVTFSATLKNQGTAATAAGVVHRVAFLVDGTTVNWSNTSTASLAIGASVTLTANTGSASKATWTSTSGTHSIVASADDTALIAESNEGNNTLSSSMTVTSSGTADLIVTSLTWTPAAPAFGNEVTFTAVIKNQGGAATPAVKHGVNFLVDGTQVNWSDTSTSSLAAGASITLTANSGPAAKASWTATAGTHTIQAYVDDTGLITESNETNNTLSASLTIAAPAGLTNGLYRIRNFWQSTKYLYEANGQVLYGTPAAGDLSSQWALVDLGTKKALWNAATGDAMTIPSTATSNDPVLTSYSDVSTNAQWTVAAGSNAGYYTMQNAAQTSWYITIEGLKGFAQAYNITPTWGSPQWAFEYVGAVPAKPAAKPDLVITDISWSPAKPTAGQAVTFSATVSNQGVGATTAGTVLGVDFSVNGTKVTWENNYTTALAAGSSVTLTANTGTSGATWAMAGTAPTISAAVDAGALITESNETNNGFTKVLTTATYGASVPYTTFEAESSTYSGTLISGSRAWGTLSSEASGRSAVQLAAAGQYVQFTTTAAAQGLVVRYSVPDTADGSSYTTGLSLYVGGVKKTDLTLTNKYSWLYGVWGTEGGNKRWSNNPNATPKNPHRFFDEVSVVLDASYPVGTVIKLMRESTNLNFASAATVTIDLAETEVLPTVGTMPSNYVSLTSYGAVANDGLDDSTAMTSAITAVTGSGGSKVGVWIPAGTFDFNVGTVGRGWDGSGTRIYLPAGVSVKGAGMWYTTIQGAFAGFHSKGSGTNVADLKVSPYDVLRDDDNGVTAMEGNFSNSTISGVWVEHAKVGVWTTQSWALVPGIPTNVTVTNNRIRDVWADGMNFHYGTSNSLASNNVFRNSGDDGMAMWSDATLDANNTFQFNTVQMPGLANGIAIYGGKDNKVLSNAVYDTIDNGAGISFGTDFSPPSITGTLQISDNLLVRTGSYHHDQAYNIGAIWGYWKNSSGRILSPVITISNNQIQNSTYAGIFIEEPSSGATVTYTGNTITSPGTYGVEIRSTAVGSATFTNTAVTGAPSGNLKNNSSSFTWTGSGNSF